MKTFCIYLALFSLFSTGIFSQENLPGDAAKINYEKAMLNFLSNQKSLAKTEFEKSIKLGGPYGDLSRLMIIRMESKNFKNKDNLENQVLKLLDGFEDQRLVPVAYFSALQVLSENKSSTGAVNLAHEFALRFPRHNLTDDSLIIAAQILFHQQKYKSALVLINKILKMNNTKTDRYNDALYLNSQIYLSDWADRSVTRACRSLDIAVNNKHQEMVSVPISSLYHLHCVPI